MSRLIAAFIRHGDYRQLADTPSALQPFPLTEKGLLQAAQAAESIHKLCQQQGWWIHQSISSSKLLRAWQTANEIAEKLPNQKIVIREYPDLAERKVGSVANLTLQQIEDLVRLDPRYDSLPPDWKSNSHFRLPFQDAESLMDAGLRVAQQIRKQMHALRNQPRGNQLKLFVGHGAAFRHAAYHLGILTFEQIAQLSMYHCHPVYIELHPDDSWQHIEGDWKVRAAHSQYTD